MNFLLQFYTGDQFVLLAANVLIQMTVVICTAWLLARFVFRHNAAIRHNIWLSALIIVLLSPFTAYLADVAGLRIIAISLPNTSQTESGVASTSGLSAISHEIAKLQTFHLQEQALAPVLSEDTGSDVMLKHNLRNMQSVFGDTISTVPQARPLSTTDWLRAIAALATAVWGLGTFYFLIRLFQRGYALRQSIQTARMIDDDSHIHHVYANIRRLLGIKKLPRILLWNDSKIRITPLTAGVFRPVIILSKNLLNSLDDDELCNVLVHECAHVLRHDPLVGLMQRIVEIVFWPYPPVWLMNRNLARAREEVCDNYVLLHTDGPRYAQTLFDLSKRVHPLSPSLAQVGLFQYSWSLEQRVAGILDARRNVMTKINRFTMGVMMALFLTAVIFVSGTRVLQAQPPAVADKAQPAASADAVPQVQRRAVNKFIKDFPEKTDLSTPESALAAFHRTMVNKDAKAVLELSYWRQSGPRELQGMENFFKSKDMDAYGQSMLDAEIIEVAIYHDDLAEVIAKLKFPEGVGRDPYSARCFGRINGLWKNLGEDRLPSLEAAKDIFENKKDGLYKEFLRDKAEITGKAKPSSGQTLSPENYARAKADTPDTERLILMGLVENFFVHNARDITARKTLEWGEVQKNADGSRSIRYKFEARIWDKDTIIANQIFTFDKDNVILSFKDIDGPPQKKPVKVVDTGTKDGMIALVEDFFKNNFRDITSRKTIEWGNVEQDKDGNSSIRYKYEAKIWDKETKIMNQIFTFNKQGEFVRYKNVEDFPKSE